MSHTTKSLSFRANSERKPAFTSSAAPISCAKSSSAISTSSTRRRPRTNLLVCSFFNSAHQLTSAVPPPNAEASSAAHDPALFWHPSVFLRHLSPLFSGTLLSGRPFFRSVSAVAHGFRHRISVANWSAPASRSRRHSHRASALLARSSSRRTLALPRTPLLLCLARRKGPL